MGAGATVSRSIITKEIMREQLKLSLLADGFGNGSDPQCLLINTKDFDEYWEWSRENKIMSRPIPFVVTGGREFQKVENNDLYNSKVVYIPEETDYIFAKMRWG